MIEMWDDMFCKQNPSIKDALSRSDGIKAFELMHKELDQVWNEIYRVLKDGGFACINIGDATRTINDNFRLYSNHSRILNYLLKLGFSALPNILWRKQTNSPTKFMGSGMLPAGAYVTLEHEYILIVRKGSKRNFIKVEEKQNRRESSFFWEERNVWFSDIWFDIKGISQELADKDTRTRSAAFPFEVAYRLINMYSVKEDVVLDPFLGTGTTTTAAMVAGRNSIGIEIDQTLADIILSIDRNIISFANDYIRKRIERHINFCDEWSEEKGTMKYTNKYYGFPVKSAQERELLLNEIISIQNMRKKTFEVCHHTEPQSNPFDI